MTGGGVLTSLRCLPGFTATKTFTWHPAMGAWGKKDFKAGTWFTPVVRHVGDIDELGQALTEIHNDQESFIVRSVVDDWVTQALERNPKMRIRRRKNSKNGDQPALVETALSWIVIDIDGIPLRDIDDLASDPESAIIHAITEHLPPAFHDAKVFWTLSSSAGFNAKLLKCHLFYWLEEPATNETIKAVIKQQAPAADWKIHHAAQPVFTARPVVVNGHDPLPRRTGFIGGEPSVGLPELRPEPLRKIVPGTPGATSSSRGVEGALARLGDGPGLDGFHEPLRTATFSYALNCIRFGERDDAALIARIKPLVEDAPRGPGRSAEDVLRYASDNYLTDLINGAFALRSGDPDIQSTRPTYDAATATAKEARAVLEKHLGAFFDRTIKWHKAPDDKPEQAGIAVTVGLGKSDGGRKKLPAYIQTMKEMELPHRVTWVVPQHKLGREAVTEMRKLGLNAGVWRGRSAYVDPAAGKLSPRMCGDLDAVADAVTIGEDIEQAVCGTGKSERNPTCPLFGECAYQAQKSALAKVDVIIAASTAVFGELPKAIRQEVGLLVIDEAFWQQGLYAPRDILADGFADEVLSSPVLMDPDIVRDAEGKARPRKKGTPYRQVQHDEGTSSLHEWATKAAKAFDGMEQGELLTKARIVATGLTADNCREAAKLEWKRKMLRVLNPGMTAKERKEAVELAMVNARIPRRAGVWKVMADLIEGEEEVTGRIELGMHSDRHGEAPAIILHAHKDVVETLTSVPILHLDAEMPVAIAQQFLPRLSVLADVRAAAPFMNVTQYLGGWGKSTLVPSPLATEEENRTRENRLRQLVDYVRWHSKGSALVVTYKDIESWFQDIDGVAVAHFNDIAGLDEHGKVRVVFIIGRPMPDPSSTRDMAKAVFGVPVPAELPHLATMGALMADGSGQAIQVRVYTDPALEAIRKAVTDGQVVQSIGRGRAVNRSADTPLDVHAFCDVLLPMPVNRLVLWQDVRLSVFQRMAARGVLYEAPAHAARAYPDLLPAAGCRDAYRAERGSSVEIPYERVLIGRFDGARALRVKYKAAKPGAHPTYAWCLPTLTEEDIRERMKAAAGGELSLFEFLPNPAAPAQPAARAPHTFTVDCPTATAPVANAAAEAASAPSPPPPTTSCPEPPSDMDEDEEAADTARDMELWAHCVASIPNAPKVLPPLPKPIRYGPLPGSNVPGSAPPPEIEEWRLSRLPWFPLPRLDAAAGNMFRQGGP